MTEDANEINAETSPETPAHRVGRTFFVIAHQMIDGKGPGTVDVVHGLILAVANVVALASAGKEDAAQAAKDLSEYMEIAITKAHEELEIAIEKEHRATNQKMN